MQRDSIAREFLNIFHFFFKRVDVRKRFESFFGGQKFQVQKSVRGLTAVLKDIILYSFISAD